MKTKRNSNIELLRIIAGFMIVIGHGQSLGGALVGTGGGTFYFPILWQQVQIGGLIFWHLLVSII